MNFKRIIIGSVLLLLCLSSAAWPSSIQVAVLYPEASDNFSKIFENLISGIKEQQDINIIYKQVSKVTSVEEIDKWLAESNVQAILSLGQLSYTLSKKLNSNIPVTVGALVISPNGHSGISLAADPRILLKHLQNLAPNIKRVFVVYSEQNTGWLIDMAKRVVNERNIELIAYEAADIKQGVKYYDEILHQLKNGEDAIWIPLDRIVPDNTILPKILQVAWERNIVVFSNNPLHTKKGTLFALFPDHRLMGKDLAQLAVDQFISKAKPHVLPAKNLKLAVNKRTASHLGLSFSKSEQQQFDIIFPSR